MRIWFDTEFYEDGHSIQLISIGAVREDGAEFYAETTLAEQFCGESEWLTENVLPHLQGGEVVWARIEIANMFHEFAGQVHGDRETPEFWGYYADYDWVVLCQLYGRMIDLPKGWPKYCRDLKQFADAHLEPGDKLPEQEGIEHHALADARWIKKAYLWLQEYDERIVNEYRGVE